MPVDVASPLPDLDLAEGTVVTVDLDDPGALVTALVIHGYQIAPSTVPPTAPPLLTAPSEE